METQSRGENSYNFTGKLDATNKTIIFENVSKTDCQIIVKDSRKKDFNVILFNKGKRAPIGEVVKIVLNNKGQ